MKETKDRLTGFFRKHLLQKYKGTCVVEGFFMSMLRIFVQWCVINVIEFIVKIFWRCVKYILKFISDIFTFVVNCAWNGRKIKKAAKLLSQGKIVAAPTETVYGLFADATNDLAIQEIYRVKGRPSCNPLIVHVSDVEMAKEIAEFSPEAERIANHFWEENVGPLTIVLKNKVGTRISPLITAGLSTVAIRCPNHKMALNLINEFGGPLAAPSANTSNSVSPTSAKMVKNDLGDKIPMILDGGKCKVGLESTILDLTQSPYVILRPGGVSKEEIEEFLGEQVLTLSETKSTIIMAPGQMKKHYSPKLPLRINAAYPVKDEAFIAFGKTGIKYDLNLSESGNLEEAAKNLFSYLKKLDNHSKHTGIAVMPIPNVGIGVAINDRLARAASSK